jgi:hypothetical protein
MLFTQQTLSLKTKMKTQILAQYKVMLQLNLVLDLTPKRMKMTMFQARKKLPKMKKQKMRRENPRLKRKKTKMEK